MRLHVGNWLDFLVVVITHGYRKAPHNDSVTTWTVLR